jgi:hypothetical protein
MDSLAKEPYYYIKYLPTPYLGSHFASQEDCFSVPNHPWMHTTHLKVLPKQHRSIDFPCSDP